MQGLLFLSKEALRNALKFTGISKYSPFIPLREWMGKVWIPRILLFEKGRENPTNLSFSPFGK